MSWGFKGMPLFYIRDSRIANTIALALKIRDLRPISRLSSNRPVNTRSHPRQCARSVASLRPKEGTQYPGRSGVTVHKPRMGTHSFASPAESSHCLRR